MIEEGKDSLCFSLSYWNPLEVPFSSRLPSWNSLTSQVISAKENRIEV
jgi:hypothetical protein